MYYHSIFVVYYNLHIFVSRLTKKLTMDPKLKCEQEEEVYDYAPQAHNHAMYRVLLHQGVKCYYTVNNYTNPQLAIKKKKKEMIITGNIFQFTHSNHVWEKGNLPLRKY